MKNLVPVSYNGHDIQGTVYASFFPVDGGLHGLPEASPGVVDRGPDNYPRYTVKTLQPRVIPVVMQTLGDWNTGARELRGWFNTADQTPRTLIAKDIDDSDKQWQISVTPISTPTVRYPVFGVNLLADDPRWTAVTAGTLTVSGTVSPISGTATTSGNLPAQPTISLTMTANKTGSYSFRRFVTLRNRTALVLNEINSAVDLTGGGLDTATLIGAAKMQADGDDLRVLVDGSETPRWFGGGGINNAATTVWCNIPLKAGVSFTIGGTIAPGDTPTSITLANTTANKTAINALPPAGIFIVDSEIFVYSSKDVTLRKLAGVSRAQYDTAAAAHATGATGYWLEHEIWMVYGNAAASAPEQDETKKPIIDLTNSTNARWVYADFSDSANLRTGRWRPSVVQASGTESTTYTATQGAYADPASVAGMQMAASQKTGTWVSETAEIVWDWYHPAGGTVVVSDGLKYRSSTTWPARCGLGKSNDGSEWATVWNEATPGTVDTWATITNAGTASLSGTYKFLKYIFRGSIGAAASNTVGFEVSSVSVGLGANVPLVILGAETASSSLDATITNTTTGEYITLKYVMALNTTLVINCAAKTVVYAGSVNALSALGLSSVRNDWLNLQPGANVITFADAGTAGMTMSLSWQDTGI